MNTTAIFVEILFAGVQSMVWIALLLLAFFGIAWPAALAGAHTWSALLAVVAFAAAYTLGIINDRCARWFFHLFLKDRTIERCYEALDKVVRILRRSRTEPGYEVDAEADGGRLAVAAKEGQLSDFLNFIRSRLRIARVTIFNTLLTMLASVLLIFLRGDELGFAPPQRLGAVLIVVALCAVVMLGAFFALVMLDHNYKSRRRQAEKLIGD